MKHLGSMTLEGKSSFWMIQSSSSFPWHRREVEALCFSLLEPPEQVSYCPKLIDILPCFSDSMFIGFKLPPVYTHLPCNSEVRQYCHCPHFFAQNSSKWDPFQKAMKISGSHGVSNLGNLWMDLGLDKIDEIPLLAGWAPGKSMVFRWLNSMVYDITIVNGDPGRSTESFCNESTRDNEVCHES